MLQSPYEPRRHASNDLPSANISTDDSTRPNNSSPPNPHARQHHSPCSNPRIVVNEDRERKRRSCLSSPLGHRRGVRPRHQHNARAKEDTVPDMQRRVIVDLDAFICKPRCQLSRSREFVTYTTSSSNINKGLNASY
jgi:hypothetical protein